MKSWLVLCGALLACGEHPSKLDAVLAPKPATAAKPAWPLTFDAAAIDAWVAAHVAERGAIGAALVVVRDGEVVLAKGYGKQRVDAAAPVTPDTPFALGSVSKQFACVLAYRLADQGLLAMTDPVAKWYPQLTRAADITLADLGGHTSGYRDYYPLDYVDARMQQPIAPDDLIAQYAGMPLDFEPRTRWSYSNTGFQILARVAEKVTGQRYGELLAAHIFQPLGMKTASIVRPPDAVVSGHVSFLLDGARPAPLEAEGWLRGAGEIWASANDLATWDLAIAEGKLLSPASQRALATPRALAHGRGTGYSCGFSVRTVNHETVLQHGGWVGGFHTRNAIIPRTKSAVVLLTNDEYTNVTPVADRIVALLTAEDAAPAIAGPPAADAVRDLVMQLQRGTVDREKLGDDANAYFDDARVATAAKTLGPLGAPSVTINTRGERGAMEVTTFTLAFPKKTVTGWMFRSPDGKVRQLLLDN